jgi:hypothetical protein
MSIKVYTSRVLWDNETEEYQDVDYDNNHDAGVTPTGALVISEIVPDVGNANDGNPTQRIRAIYNKTAWEKVEIND